MNALLAVLARLAAWSGGVNCPSCETPGMPGSACNNCGVTLPG